MKFDYIPHIIILIGLGIFLYLDKDSILLQNIKFIISENLLLTLIIGVVILLLLKHYGKI